MLALRGSLVYALQTPTVLRQPLPCEEHSHLPASVWEEKQRLEAQVGEQIQDRYLAKRI